MLIIEVPIGGTLAVNITINKINNIKNKKLY